MLQIRNPYFTQSVTIKKAALRAPEIDAWLKTQPMREFFSLADLKAALPTAAGDLSREVVNEIAGKLGLLITNPQDTEGIAAVAIEDPKP